nr:CBS domain-containing protein [Methanosphaerula palustris]
MAKPITIAKSAVITEALDKMLNEGTDPLIVTQGNVVAGTVSRKAIAEALGSKKNATISPSKIHVANVIEEEFTSAYPDQGLEVLIPLLQHYKLIVVLDKDHRLIGQVTAANLLKVMVPQVPLTGVIEKVNSINADERVVHLRRRIIDDNESRYVVTDSEGLIGMVTETDVARSMREFREEIPDKHQDHRIRNLIVRDIMSSPLISVDAGVDTATVAQLLLARSISAVPVVEGGRIAGVVTRRSLVNAL